MSLVLGHAFSLATSVLITRAGGASVRGQVTTVATWGQVLGWVAAFSLDKAIVSMTRDEPGRLSTFARFAFRIGLRNAIGIAALGALALGHALSDVRLVLIAAAVVVATTVTELSQGLALSRQQLRQYSIARVVQPISYLTFAALSALTFGERSGPTLAFAFALGLLGSVVVAGAVALRNGRKHLDPPIRSAPPIDDPGRRRLLRFAGSTQLATAASFLNARLDLVVLPFIAQPRTVGIYAVAASAAQFVALGGSATFLRHFSTGAERRDRGGLAIAASLSALLLLTAPWILPFVFGEEFSASVGLAQILALGAVASYGMQAVTGTLLVQGRPLAIAGCEAVGVVVFLVGLLVDRRPAAVAIASAVGFFAAWASAEVLRYRPVARD